MRHTCIFWITVFSAGFGCAGSPQAPSSHVATRETTTAIAERLAKNPSGLSSNEDAQMLRAVGPTALDLLIADAGATPSAAQKERIDEVAQQRDAYASHLYWYTDLEAAKRAAKTSGKPIVALRMLGNLTDELSCANSRFFRTALYPNKEVSAELHDRFILYWSAERPAPTITIDFHDGRKIERTVTGNSLHYVLDAEGRPLDAIPGLYSPHAFLQALNDSLMLADSLASLNDGARSEALREYHRRGLAAERARWSADFATARLPAQAFLVADTSSAPNQPDMAPANLAIPIAVGKALVEAPMVNAMMPSSPPPVDPIDTVPWSVLSAARRNDTHLDSASRALIRAKHPMDWSDATAPHALSDSDLDHVIDNFEKAMAEDTEKNELSLHASIHAWLVAEPAIDFAALNKRVYDNLFLTPRSDPWLGLVPPGTFTGIENDGVIPR
ncbi:MAG: hypothetical protein ABI183_14325 [Polyangiaceae bacterium]